MCKKTKGLHNRIDPCMKDLIKFVNSMGWKTLASCCGHGKYPITIVAESRWEDKKIIELLSITPIPRTRNFYVKDKQGYYFIPEVINAK